MGSSCVYCATRSLNCDETQPECHLCLASPFHSCTYNFDPSNPRLYAVFPPFANFNDRILPFALGARIGGHFGVLHRGDLKEGGHVAVKLLFRERHMRSPAILQSLQEAWKWSQLQHPNIVTFLGIVNYQTIRLWGAPQICLVSRWMPDGNVMDFIGRHPNVNRLPLLMDAVLGLGYLHSQTPKIIHGGLRGANLIIEVLGNGEPRAQIRDFGHQRAVQIFSKEYEVDSALVPTLGNPRWIAFERLSPWEYGFDSYDDAETVESDVFELVRTFLEILTGRPPFHYFEEDRFVENMVRQWHNPERPAEICPGLDNTMWQMMQGGWSRRIENRPGLEEIRCFLQNSIGFPDTKDDEWVFVSTILPEQPECLSVVQKIVLQRDSPAVDSRRPAPVETLCPGAAADSPRYHDTVDTVYGAGMTDPAPAVNRSRSSTREPTKEDMAPTNDWFMATWSKIRRWVWGA